MRRAQLKCTSFSIHGFSCMYMVLCGCYSIAHGGDENGFLVVSSSSFEPNEAAVCSNMRVNLEQNHSSVWLPLADRHGPCAPWKTKSSRSRPSLAETLRRNRARSNYIMSRASRGMGSAQEDVEIPTHLSNFVDTLYYVVTVGLGTPAVQQIVLIDTGSDLSLVQCKPECNNPGECPSQKDPLFDPSRSSTYNPVRCDSNACRNLLGADYGKVCTNGTNSQQCRFNILYADNTKTAGVYSSDRLTLTRHGDTVDNFHFGCDQDHRTPSETYDGLLALGRRPMSLVGQTSSLYRGAFSYCLPAVDSRSGFLALGVRQRSAAAASGFVFTPLRSPHTVDDSYYEVTMTGIAVGGKRLDLQPSVFAGGMVIDSGTIVTFLQSTVYRALLAAFREAMAAYPLLPHGPLPLDTCFNLTGHKNVVLPKVALMFSGGATIDLDEPNGILLEGCLAFADAGADKSGVLGNVNPRNFEVLYDTSNSRVGFRANAC